MFWITGAETAGLLAWVRPLPAIVGLWSRKVPARELDKRCPDVTEQRTVKCLRASTANNVNRPGRGLCTRFLRQHPTCCCNFLEPLQRAEPSRTEPRRLAWCRNATRVSYEMLALESDRIWMDLNVTPEPEQGFPGLSPAADGLSCGGSPRLSPFPPPSFDPIVNRHRFWWYGIHALKLSVLRYTTLWWCSPDFCCTVCTSPGGISGLCINPLTMWCQARGSAWTSDLTVQLWLVSVQEHTGLFCCLSSL